MCLFLSGRSLPRHPHDRPTPKFVPPRWGRTRFDPTQKGLCKFGRGFGARCLLKGGCANSVVGLELAEFRRWVSTELLSAPWAQAAMQLRMQMRILKHPENWLGNASHQVSKNKLRMRNLLANANGFVREKLKGKISALFHTFPHFFTVFETFSAGLLLQIKGVLLKENKRE